MTVELAREVAARVGALDWGPWVNGGAWTRMRGTKLDLLYRDLGLAALTATVRAAG